MGFICSEKRGAATARSATGIFFGPTGLFFRGITGDDMTKSRNIGRGGARPGAGRPLGSKNKPIFELPEQRAHYAHVRTPLDYLLAVMRDPLADVRRRCRAAKAAAPYCHSKPAAKAPD
jgi:hypothetical protein